MAYSITEPSDLAGVSTRTLRYYDQIGLLKPLYVKETGYRYYGEEEVNRLQQILFYRARGFDLKTIQHIIYQDNFDIIQALEEHLQKLEEERKRADILIQTVKQTISCMKGVGQMTDQEKFKGFKEKVVQENEAQYGKEIRSQYGDESVDAANKQVLDMTKEQWESFKKLENEIKEKLKEGVNLRIEPESNEAKEIVKLHKAWLCMTWKKYTVSAHQGVSQMYVLDERFKVYYDEEVEGCAELLNKAILYWADKI